MIWLSLLIYLCKTPSVSEVFVYSNLFLQVSTEPQHAHMLSEKGGELIQVLHRLQQTASSHADIALSSLAGDILKVATIS